VKPIILASGSASRAALLRAAGVDFTVRVSGVDEDATKRALQAHGASPAEVAAALAEEKAAQVSVAVPGLVIGADQTLDADGVLYDKTHSPAETRARLGFLRGRSHRLHAAVTVAENGRILWKELHTAELRMRDFSAAFLDAYLDRHGEAVASSVGAYHLEGEGVQLFDHIEGDYFSILGLPMLGLLGFLREAGALSR
jgi:septum formation protein